MAIDTDHVTAILNTGPHLDVVLHDDDNDVGARQIGIPGPIGPIGPRGIEWLGEYNEETVYKAGHAICHDGSSYIFIHDHPESHVHPPNESCWDILSLHGDHGHPSEPSDVYLDIINDNPQAVYVDTMRGDTVLSVATHIFSYNGSEKLTNNKWLHISGSNGDKCGYIMPCDGTIIGGSVYCEDDNNHIFSFDLYVNELMEVPSLFTTTGNGENQSFDYTLSHNVDAGTKIRIRLSNNGGKKKDKIKETLVSIFIKWRKI